MKLNFFESELQGIIFLNPLFHFTMEVETIRWSIPYSMDSLYLQLTIATDIGWYFFQFQFLLCTRAFGHLRYNCHSFWHALLDRFEKFIVHSAIMKVIAIDDNIGCVTQIPRLFKTLVRNPSSISLWNFNPNSRT